MSQAALVPTSPVPSPTANAAQLLRWVSCHNPFYVLSACLFLFGLWMSFRSQIGDVAVWSLIGGLSGYTLLLAATAFVLVRFVKDWEDLRTVLLLVVLMFLATSVTFDEVLVLDPARGRALYLGGLAFTVLVSEVVLRGIRLRLPAWYRLPYYLILALFFLYPLGLSQLKDQPHSEALLWGLFGFASLAGVIFLTLLPAIRRGPEYVQDNGSPWNWPLYPWVLFGMLALAVVGRSYLLCTSMQLLSAADWGRHIFGLYFLIPFGFAICVLFMEMGIVTGRRTVTMTALMAPLGLVALSLIGHRDDAIYREFLDNFTERLGGNPLYLTVLATVVFYVYAALRRVHWATEALTGALLALAVIGPDNIEWEDLNPLVSLPVLAAVLLQVVLLCWRRDLWRCSVAALVVGCWLAQAGWWCYVAARQFVSGIDHILLSLSLFAVALLVSLHKGGMLSRWSFIKCWPKQALEGANGSGADVGQGDVGQAAMP